MIFQIITTLESREPVFKIMYKYTENKDTKQVSIDLNN